MLVMNGGMGLFGRTREWNVASSMCIPFWSKMMAAISTISDLLLLRPVVSRSKIPYRA
jgi:hypothetical protein